MGLSITQEVLRADRWEKGRDKVTASVWVAVINIISPRKHCTWHQTRKWSHIPHTRLSNKVCLSTCALLHIQSKHSYCKVEIIPKTFCWNLEYFICLANNQGPWRKTESWITALTLWIIDLADLWKKNPSQSKLWVLCHQAFNVPSVINAFSNAGRQVHTRCHLNSPRSNTYTLF